MKVSIITPSFNRADIIGETATSIFNQTYSDWEWVVVDDGSTDESWNILQQYASLDERVKVYRRDREPKGASVCRNIAVDKSTGSRLIFLDSDDLLASFCLEQRVKAVQNSPQVDCIIFNMVMFKNDPLDLGMLWNAENGHDEITRLLMGNPICQGTGTIWRKDSFIKIGKWKEDLKLWQDIELHLRSFLNGISFSLRLDLPPDAFIRVSDISLSRTDFHSLAKFESRVKVFSETLSTIKAKSNIEEYFVGLRSMGGELIISGFKSHHFSLADNLLKLCSSNAIFNNSENYNFKLYKWGRQLKLFKFPFIESHLLSRIRQFLPIIDNTIGKLKYDGVIKT